MPLLSLIEDNLNYMLELGVPACSLSFHSLDQEDKSIGQLYRDIQKLKYKIVYLTPEKLVKSQGLMNTLE